MAMPSVSPSIQTPDDVELNDLSITIISERAHAPPLEKPTRRYQIILVLSGFLMIFHTIGINFVFGIFQEFYTSPQSNIKDATSQYALVSLVGTLGSGLTWSGGIFVNPIMARTQRVKTITLLGAFLMSLGLFLASYSTRLWHLYMTQSLIYGVGSSMYYFPLMTITPVYFDRHRGFAMGVILAGAGVGGLVLAPVTQAMLDKLGIGWTLRALGIWNFAVAVPISFVVKPRAGFGLNANGERARTRLNMSLVRRGTFLYQSVGAFLQAAGNIVPTYYLTLYSVSVLAYPRSTGSNLLAVNSAVNSISRVIMGVLADHVGRQNTLITGVVLSGISVFSLWYSAARERFIAFVVIYGIYAGGYNALLPTTITEIYGVENYASVNGFIYFIRGLGSMFGAPIAGVILGTYNRSGNGDAAAALQDKFNDVVVYDGVLLLAAGLCVSYVRFLDARDKGKWSWRA
ncbi:monocarboxylate transporter [Mucidula mucida]|nr:monocarboxylate transporter [Mucidula mucida]